MKFAAALLAGAIGLHIFLFNQIPLQFDELLMFELISRYRTWNLIPLLYIEETQQPLGYLIAKFFMTISDTTFSMRIPSLIMTMLTPWALYKLARLTLSREDSLKAGVLLILFYPFMMYSGSMRPYVPFVLFTTTAFYQYLKPERNKWTLAAAIAALFFTHPLGSAIALILTGKILLKRKNGVNLILALGFISTLLGTIALLYRHEDLSNLIVPFSFKTYFKAMYNFSFLISGREYFTFFTTMAAAAGYFKFRKKDLKFKIEPIWIHSYGWSILSALILMLFFGKHLYPRHYMFLLPGLAIITIQLINYVTPKQWLRNTLFAVGALTLVYKSVYKEKLHKIPFEIDSYGMASKSRELAKGHLPIVSCGNCFTYYLKEESHLCTGSSLPANYFSSTIQAVYIELNYVVDKCGLDKISDKFKVEETFKFKGGKVHRISFL